MKNVAIVVLVVMVIFVFFAGCLTPTPADPIRADINSDNSTEFIYLEMDESKAGNDWDLKAMKGYGKEHLSAPTVIMSFETKPENLGIEDYNGDGINDVVFLIINRSAAGNDRYYDWHLMVTLGTESGQFLKPKIIATFERQPGSP
ncbi:MAG: hypothetical protein WC998_02755 [Candidatus Paceibacterota bacterium]|jgi:hypothetical protein